MKYINVDPLIMGGQAVMSGTRFPISQLIATLAEGTTIDEFVDDYEYPKELVVRALHELADLIRSKEDLYRKEI